MKSPVHSLNGHLAATPRVVSRFVLPVLASLVAAFAAAPAHAVLGGAPMATPNGATANGAVSRAAVVPGGASAFADRRGLLGPVVFGQLDDARQRHGGERVRLGGGRRVRHRVAGTADARLCRTCSAAIFRSICRP